MDRTKWAEIGCIVGGVGTPISIGISIWFGLHPRAAQATSAQAVADQMSTATVVGLSIEAVLVSMAAFLAFSALRRLQAQAVDLRSRVEGEQKDNQRLREVIQGNRDYSNGLEAKNAELSGQVNNLTARVEDHRVKAEEHWNKYLKSRDEVELLRVSERDAVTGRDTARRNLEDSYKTMREYEERISNLANQVALRLHLPDIAGNVHNLQLESHGELRAGNNRTIHCVLKMAFALTSLGPEAAKIDKIALVSIGKRACRNIDADMPERPVLLTPQVVRGGIFVARIEFEDDGSNTIPQPLFLVATDVYNGKHYLSVNDPIPDLPPAEMPQLFIEYREVDRHDTLTFSNHGPGAIQNIVVGQIQLSKFDEGSPKNSVNSTVEISQFSGVGMIMPGKEHMNWRFGAKKDQTLAPLRDLLRDFLQHNWQTEFSVVVTYEDMGARRFSRRFVLCLDVYSNLIIQADAPKERILGVMP